jgi:hypothetical protein
MCVQILLVTSYYNMDLRWSNMLAEHIQHNVHLQQFCKVKNNGKKANISFVKNIPCEQCHMKEQYTVTVG